MNWRKRIVALTAAGVLAIVTIIPALATTTSFTSLGCYGSGETKSLGTNHLFSETKAWVDFTATPCNYLYIQGDYRAASNGIWWTLGPGWGGLGQPVSVDVTGADKARFVAHTSCQAGGPCLYPSYGWTSYNYP